MYIYICKYIFIIYIYLFTYTYIHTYIYMHIYICLWCSIPCIVGSIGTVCSIGPHCALGLVLPVHHCCRSVSISSSENSCTLLVGIMGSHSHWLSEFDFSFHEKVIGFALQKSQHSHVGSMRTRDLQVGLSFSWNSLTEKKIYVCHVQYMIEIKHFFQGMVWGYHVQKSYNVSTMSLCDQLVSCFLFVFFTHFCYRPQAASVTCMVWFMSLVFKQQASR